MTKKLMSAIVNVIYRARVDRGGCKRDNMIFHFDDEQQWSRRRGGGVHVKEFTHKKSSPLDTRPTITHLHLRALRLDKIHISYCVSEMPHNGGFVGGTSNDSRIDSKS